MFDYLDKLVPKNDDYVYAEHFGQDGCSTKWLWILGVCLKNIFSLDQVPLWGRPFCRIFTFWFLSFHIIGIFVRNWLQTVLFHSCSIKSKVFFANNVLAIFVQMKAFWKELQQWSHWNLPVPKGKSKEWEGLFALWQPQPIHLQNGGCLEKMLKTIENINSLQNGYLFSE